MATLHEWKEILKGPFVGQPHVDADLSIGAGRGASMECLVRHQNGDIWHMGEQHNPRPNVPGWRTAVNLGGRGLIAEPLYSRGQVMGRGQDNRLYRYANGQWQLQDAIWQFPPDGLDRSGQAGRGLNNEIWVEGANNQAGWANLGGDMRGRPALLSHTLVAARGADTALYVAQSPGYDAVFGGWLSLEGQIGGNTAVVSFPYMRTTPSPRASQPRYMMVLARGASNSKLWMRQKVAGATAWEGWVDLGGDFQGSPSVAQVEGEDTFYCVVRGRTDNRIKCLPYVRGQRGQWQDWGGEVTSDPVAYALPGAAANGSPRVRVFAIGMEGSLWERTLA